MTSPLSKGLFQRVIGESGTVLDPGVPRTLSQAERQGEALATAWKVPSDASAEDLRSVSAADVLKAEPTAVRATISTAFPYEGVIVDGYVVPARPTEVFASGLQHRVGLLLGHNARDRVPGSTSPSDLKNAIDEAYGPLAERA